MWSHFLFPEKLSTFTESNNTKMETLLLDLENLGVIGPLSKYGHDLSDIKELSSDCQIKRGNRRFYDPRTDVYYVSYSNGYVRRINHKIHFLGFPHTVMYPLNKRIRNPKDGEGSVVMEPCPEKRIQMVIASIRKYRN